MIENDNMHNLQDNVLAIWEYMVEQSFEPQKNIL